MWLFHVSFKQAFSWCPFCTCCFSLQWDAHMGLKCPIDTSQSIWTTADRNIQMIWDQVDVTLLMYHLIPTCLNLVIHVCFYTSENAQLMRLSPKMDLHLELPCCWAAELILKCILFHGSLLRGQISAIAHVVVTKHNMLWPIWETSLLPTASCCPWFMPHSAAYCDLWW